MANFQLPEANFQFMTIFPLIQKQRQRKMLGREQPGIVSNQRTQPGIAQPAVLSPLPSITKEKESQPTAQALAPILHFSLPCSPSPTEH